MNIPTPEGGRRLRNCSREVSEELKMEQITRLMVQMKWSGYPESVRETLTRRILVKHQNDVRNLQVFGRPMLRSVEDRAKAVKEYKATWFRCQGATATIQIPCTPGSILASMVKKTLLTHRGPVGTSVKVVKRPGMKIHTGLSTNNPFKRDSCQRKGCPILESGGKCREHCW